MFFMLLSCFAFIYSATVAVLCETPRGRKTDFQILQESPGTIEEAERARKASELDALSPPQRPDFFEQKQSFYYVYMAVTNPGSDEHMTLRRTIVNASTYRRLLQKLKMSNENSPVAMNFPCKIGLQLYHDGPTGLMSPSRSIQRAFLLSTPFSVRHWIRASEMLNQSAPIVSEFLELIPDVDIELGHHPLAHTTRSVCQRGMEYPATYTRFHVEMRRITDPGIQTMLQRNISRMNKLKDLIHHTNFYLKENAAILSEDCPEIFHGKTIAETLRMIEEINATGNKLRQARKRITPQFSQKWTDARVALSIILEGYRSIYDQIDNDLKPLFKAAGPNVAICHMIASLELMALQRDMGQVE